jgi:glyoxylase-like metal-dependent hydrolase (beta-lactamase superfamily II)
MGKNTMKLYILDLGYQECDGLLMTLNSSIGTSSNRNPQNAWTKWAAFSVLIEHPQKGWIIFDTGVHPDAMNGYLSEFLQDFSPYYHDEDQTMINQLAKIGLKPTDIQTVVLSHAHFDHTGGLNLFTNAEVYWARADFDAAMEALYSVPGNPEYVAYVRADIGSPKVKKINFVDEDFALAEGIDVIHLPGHSPDILGLLVHLEGGTIILPSDAIYSPANYGDPDNGIPPVLPGSFYDSTSCKKSVEKVRKLQKKYNAKIIFSHDYEYFKTLKPAPDFYS